MITEILILITVVISILAWQSPKWYDILIHNPYQVKNNNEYFRLLTSGFIHADFLHLFFNMFVLYGFGKYIEVYFFKVFNSYGAFVFALFYILAIIVSSLPSQIKHYNNGYYNSLGASGGVSAVLFAFILLKPFAQLQLFLFFPLPAVVYGILYMLYTQYMIKKGTDNINHEAHYIGAIFGFIFPLCFEPLLIVGFFKEILRL